MQSILLMHMIPADNTQIHIKDVFRFGKRLFCADLNLIKMLSVYVSNK